MWITRARYEQLVQADAEAKVWRERYAQIERLWEQAHDRADRAVEAMLASRNLPPLSEPTPPPLPDLPMFEEDPKELEELMKQAKADPLAVLFPNT